MRLPAFFCAALVMSAGCAVAQSSASQSSASQSGVPRLQDATVVARNGTISITRLPIRTPAGLIYRDVTIELHVDADGRVTLATDGAGRALAGSAPGAPAQRLALQAVPSGTAPSAQGSVQSIELPQRPSPPTVFQHFTSGTYAASDGSLAQLQDRGLDLIHGVPMWSISAEGGPIGSATFYSGPPRLNPRSSRLARAGLTGEEYAYGTSDSGTGDIFGSGALIGVSQQGKTLRVVSFHHGCCSDGSEPAGSVVYTLVGG